LSDVEEQGQQGDPASKDSKKNFIDVCYSEVQVISLKVPQFIFNINMGANHLK